jgi:hypothetical protein
MPYIVPSSEEIRSSSRYNSASKLNNLEKLCKYSSSGIKEVEEEDTDEENRSNTYLSEAYMSDQIVLSDNSTCFIKKSSHQSN